MLPRLLAVALACRIGLAPASAIYRCEAAGRVTYTDSPCVAAAAAYVPAAPMSVMHALRAPALAAAYDARVERERVRNGSAQESWARALATRRMKADAVRGGVVTGRAVKGMTAAELRQALGEPAQVARDDDKNGSRERWTFAGSDGSRQTVTLRDGEVTGVHATRGDGGRRRR